MKGLFEHRDDTSVGGGGAVSTEKLGSHALLSYSWSDRGNFYSVGRSILLSNLGKVSIQSFFKYAMGFLNTEETRPLY